MAINTSNTHLYYGKSGAWTEPTKIKTVPAMFGEPETIETTTLSDTSQTYIQGIKKVDGNLTFSANYDSTEADSIIAMEGTSYKWVLVIGGTISGTTVSTTNQGIFTWDGTCSYGIAEGKVNAAMEANLYVSPSTEIKKVASLPALAS